MKPVIEDAKYLVDLLERENASEAIRADRLRQLKAIDEGRYLDLLTVVSHERMQNREAHDLIKRAIKILTQ